MGTTGMEWKYFIGNMSMNVEVGAECCICEPQSVVVFSDYSMK